MRPGTRVLLVGVLLPALAAGLLVWSTTGRDEQLDRIPVAIVNDDTIITGPQPMAAGRALTAALTEPTGSGPTLDWTLTDHDDAAAGLRDGDYYAVLTIPSDFSAAILSLGSDRPVQGQLTLTSNAAASTTAPYLSEVVAEAAASALGDQTTQGYLGQVYAGFNQLASGNERAAASAAELANGTDQLAVGAEDLDDGAVGLATGLAGLADGAAELAAATDAVAAGTSEVATGSEELAAGARGVDAGADALARSAQALAAGEDELDRAAGRLAAGARRTAEGARAVAEGNRELARAVARAARVCDRLRDRGDRGDRREDRRGDRSAREGRLCRALDLARTSTRRLADGATEVAAGASSVAAGSRGVAQGSSGLAAGARRLASGGVELQRGTRELAGSADRLTQGADAVARGARGLDAAAGSLADGAAASADGAEQLAGGSSTLSSSASQVDQGSRQLSDGLAEAADKSPRYSTKQQRALEPVVSRPVVLASSVQHTGHGNGWLVALVLGLVLWLAVGAAVAGRGVTGVLEQGAAPVSSGRLAALHLGPAVGLAALQAGAAVAVLPLLGVTPASALVLAGLSVLAAVTFMLTALVLRWAYGVTGLGLFVLLLALQAAALGNVLPLETAPDVLQRLNGVLPLTAYVDGASRAVAGGQVGSWAGAVAVLVAWAAVTGVGSLLVVRRRRMPPAPGEPVSERMTGIEPA